MSTVVVHVGSDSVHAGLASDTAPRVAFAPLVDGQNPVQNGMVSNWDQWLVLVKRAFTELGVPSQGASVAFSEVPLNTKVNREKLTQLAFDALGVANMYLSIDGMLALFGTDRTTGVAVHSEGSRTFVVPAYQGYAAQHAILQHDYSSRELDAYMQKLAAKRGYSVDLETAKQLRKQLGYIALDYDVEVQKAASGALNASATIQGKTYTLGRERVDCPEALFQPSALGLQLMGMGMSTYAGIFKCDLDQRRELYANIVLSGEATMVAGIAERLQKEVTTQAPSGTKVVVTAPANRNYLPFLGGAKLATALDSSQGWVTKAEYTKSGPSIVTSKCF